MIQINKTYTTKEGGTKRTVLKFSCCGRFAYAVCKTKSGYNFYDWYFINARQFEKEVE
jgi:hypothetical protein